MRSTRDAVADPSRVSATPWRITGRLPTGSVLAGLDTSLVNVGLASIGRQLDAPLATVQWVNSTYLAAMATALPACGWLCRWFDAGRLWLTGLVWFTGASVLCAAAPHITALIVARVLRGAAGGLLIPAGMTVLNRVFRAAAEVFFVGAALFGGLVVLPLYLQLMALSIGAAVVLPAAGVLSDRYRGGTVAVTGLLVTIASTLPMRCHRRCPTWSWWSSCGSPAGAVSRCPVRPVSRPRLRRRTELAGPGLLSDVLVADRGRDRGPAAASWLASEQRRNPITRLRRTRWVPNDQDPIAGVPTKIEPPNEGAQ